MINDNAAGCKLRAAEGPFYPKLPKSPRAETGPVSFLGRQGRSAYRPKGRFFLFSVV